MTFQIDERSNHQKISAGESFADKKLTRGCEGRKVRFTRCNRAFIIECYNFLKLYLLYKIRLPLIIKIMMEIKAKIENIKKILVDDEKFYQIPDYQRPYSWDKDNVSDLIYDLTEAYLFNENETYFCGSLVIVRNDNDKRFDIIDGQQRITTFTIIACVFRDFYSNHLQQRSEKYIVRSIHDEFESSKRKLRFLTSEKYQIDFEETVLRGIDFSKEKRDKRKIDNKFLQNAFYIKNFVEEIFTEKIINPDKFIVFLFEKVVLTVITCPSQDTAISIFNVLNDRGMPLSSIDILKASLMRDIKDQEDRNAFKAKWVSSPKSREAKYFF